MTCAEDVMAWLARNPDALAEGATFVVDLEVALRLAPRRSEHVACAAGQAVLSAGELTFGAAGTIARATNLSTGYCPEPEIFAALAAALARAGLRGPSRFSPEVIFRRCPGCGQINVVKERWYFCALCDAELPPVWNFGR